MNIKINLRHLLILTLFEVILALTAFAGGYLFAHDWVPVDDRFPILNEAYTILQDNALLDLPPDSQLEYGMIRGMLQVYNEPYTTFLEPPQHELQSDELAGKYGGIGARLQVDDQARVIMLPLPDSPAQKAGLLDGDALLGVDQLVITADTAADDIEAALRGPTGSTVMITFGRPPAYQPQEVSLTRAEFPLPSVVYNLALQDSRVGIIKVNIIASTTPTEIQAAVESLQAQGATYYILDLRDNVGGLVDAGVDSARLFLESGTIIQSQYRDKPVTTYNTDHPGPWADLPLVVLVNHGTASAAEILAGGLQANHRAELIGQTTYGKDTIQLVFDLQDHSSLHVTAAHWWIPDLGRFLDGQGLEPDVLLSDEEMQSNAPILAAIQQLLP
ncbi:MAG: S41 family peptidase [Chloroflexi bacterium]|nr:S41 family peptidase [Chloroflexota bacterium]